jgi:hypothetical protein
MSTAKGAALGIRLAFGFYGLLFMAIAFIAIATAKPPSEKPRIYTKHPPDADFPYHS